MGHLGEEGQRLEYHCRKREFANSIFDYGKQIGQISLESQLEKSALHPASASAAIWHLKNYRGSVGGFHPLGRNELCYD